MAKKTRAHVLEALRYSERRVASGPDDIEKQRRVIERLEARGDTITAAAARVVLASMERAHQGRIARRDRVKRRLARG